MINKVAFTGRETMLTDGLKKAAPKAQEFVAASSILPELPKAKIAQPFVKHAEYTSPFAPTGNGLEEELAKRAAAAKKFDLFA